MDIPNGLAIFPEPSAYQLGTDYSHVNTYSNTSSVCDNSISDTMTMTITENNSPSSSSRNDAQDLNDSSDNTIVPSNEIKINLDDSRPQRTESLSIGEEAVPDVIAELNKDNCLVEESNSRRVHFHDDRLVLSYLEPKDHWKTAEPCTSEELIDCYKKACELQQARPIPILLEQLQGINLHLCNERYDMLGLKGVKLDHKHIETMEEIFRRVQFKSLDFENTNLDDDMAISLFDMIEFYESCTKLNIAMNSKITYRGFQTCSRMLKKSQNLSILILRGIIFADVSMPALARSLRCGSYLSVLHMENCNINGRNLLILVSALKMNDHLRELYLCNNKMMTTDGIQLGALLKANTRLQLLDIRANLLGDVGVSHLCDGLYEQTGENGLLSLSLWSNSLTQLGMPAMAQALKRCKNLQTLNLANNVLTSEGAHYLREGLLCNRSLLRLSLFGCKISCEGAVALAEYIADTKQLLRLDLRENDIRTGGLMALTLALNVNKSVTRLDLDREPKKDPGVKDYLGSQRESLQQIDSHLTRNRAIANDAAERMLEAELSLLSVEKSNEGNEIDADQSNDSPSDSTDPNDEDLSEENLIILENDENSESLRRPRSLEIKSGEQSSKLSLNVNIARSPSPTCDGLLGGLVVSPTDELLVCPLSTECISPASESASSPTSPEPAGNDVNTATKSKRVLGMRSEMKTAVSGRTFLVTTTVYDEDKDGPIDKNQVSSSPELARASSFSNDIGASQSSVMTSDRSDPSTVKDNFSPDSFSSNPEIFTTIPSGCEQSEPCNSVS